MYPAYLIRRAGCRRRSTGYLGLTARKDSTKTNPAIATTTSHRRPRTQPAHLPAYRAQSAGSLSQSTEFLCSQSPGTGQKLLLPFQAPRTLSAWVQTVGHLGTCPPGPILTHPHRALQDSPTPAPLHSLPSTVSLVPSPKDSCPVFTQPWEAWCKPHLPPDKVQHHPGPHLFETMDKPESTSPKAPFQGGGPG